MILALRLPSAALDLLRLAVLHPSLPDAFANEPHKLVDAIVEAGQLSSDQDGAANVAINCMMCVRALSNLCCTNAGRRVLLATLNKVGSGTAGSAGSTINSSAVLLRQPCLGTRAGCSSTEQHVERRGHGAVPLGRGDALPQVRL